MTIEAIKAALPGLELSDKDWADLSSLTETETKDFPVAMGQIRVGLMAMCIGELQATMLATLRFMPTEVKVVAAGILARTQERFDYAMNQKGKK